MKKSKKLLEEMAAFGRTPPPFHLGIHDPNHPDTITLHCNNNMSKAAAPAQEGTPVLKLVSHPMEQKWEEDPNFGLLTKDLFLACPRRNL